VDVGIDERAATQPRSLNDAQITELAQVYQALVDSPEQARSFRHAPARPDTRIFAQIVRPAHPWEILWLVATPALQYANRMTGKLGRARLQTPGCDRGCETAGEDRGSESRADDHGPLFLDGVVLF
jgi:hypothetical protein